jgi:hypothetical protein
MPKRQSMPWYRWLRWGDYLVYAGIIVASVLLFLQGPAMLKPVSGSTAQIVVSGQVIQIVSAAELASDGHFELEANGLHYKIEYADGRIRISEADCPDQVCVQTGWVSRFGEVAACVPGNLILSVDPGPQTDKTPRDEDDYEVDVIVQ